MRLFIAAIMDASAMAFGVRARLCSPRKQQEAVMPAPKPVKSALDLIGNTSMVELTHFDTGPCQLFVKLENQNPGGSIKDRVALAMIEAAERDGKLRPGGTVIEATAG